ncbi:bifunctional methylenetetrahydrofolate dehydrogenase/methenyltetrahydrofolate cyclohydrolase, partial [Lactobacillus sp. XV13L]|nr:bifunctional methylenetetrahydrofolate dehydrogenase/methenyltetrahydrofolate cyclohydrolase [Lactobacillus sp. XV13L]
MGQLLDGKLLADVRAAALKEKVKKLKHEGIRPLFCVVNVGDDAGSKIYLKTKKKRADEVGIAQRVYQLPASASQGEVCALLDRLNADERVHGVMIQLPVPGQIDVNEALEHIDPEKDVDCLTPSNIGRLWRGDHFVEPATVHGILTLLDHYHINLRG